MLSPVSHTATTEKTRRYGLEPYVMAADVYGAEPHVGRGGWSWYTGSSGWMMRAIVEALLGLRMLEGKSFEIAPCVPDDWPGFTLTVRLPPNYTVYEIRAANPDRRARGVVAATVDGTALTVRDGVCICPRLDDGRTHRVDLRLGEPEARAE
jgi:cyclic beta-1,2-glucan synthetase